MDLSRRKLVDLPRDLPPAVGFFDCHNNNLKSLIGSPNKCQNFDCTKNELTSLFGVSKVIKLSLWSRMNPHLTDVSDLWNSTVGCVSLDLNPNLAVLPLVKFNIMIYGKLVTVSEIVTKNNGSSKQNIINCQYELFDVGLENHARWKP